jgi:hypothetical protein
MNKDELEYNNNIVETLRVVKEILSAHNISIESNYALSRFSFFLAIVNTCTIVFLLARG